MIDKKLLDILNSVQIVQKYEQLLDENTSVEEAKYSVDDLKNILKSLNNNFKYFKKEDFFQLKEKNEKYMLQLNVAFPYSRVEFILYLEDEQLNIKDGGPFTSLIRIITEDKKRFTDIPFSDMDQLVPIMKHGLNLFSEIQAEIEKCHTS